MVFADFFTDFLGWGCGMFILIVWLIVWAISSVAKEAGKVIKSEEFQEGVKIGFWAWFLSNDD